MTDCVLDASALLALLNREQGAERVARALGTGVAMSAVNLSEVVAKLADLGMPEVEIRDALESLGIEFVDFDVAAAFAAGMLRPVTRAVGLSLGDRACLALGHQKGVLVLTADRSWAGLSLGADDVAVEVVR